MNVTNASRLHLAGYGMSTACGKVGNKRVTSRFLERVNCPDCRRKIERRSGKLRVAH